MALTDNNGSQYYGKPIGIASVSSNLISNNGTSYYWLSCNDYILWGQPIRYPHPQANNGTQYYFYTCSVSSDAGLVLTANNGTKYYYTSSFNCISFPIGTPFGLYVLQSNGSYVLQSNGSYVLQFS